MHKCACGSYAINPSQHGREEGVDLDLCDVCYWRKRAELIQPLIPEGFDYWDEDPEYPPEDWYREVVCSDTRQGYWAWVAGQKELYDDEAAFLSDEEEK